MKSLSRLIAETVLNIQKIIELARANENLTEEKEESLISAIDELLEIPPGTTFKIKLHPLRQTQNGYLYGIEEQTDYIYIPFSKIEWFLNQLLRIQTRAESEALCSMTFDRDPKTYPKGTDQFYAENYPPENEWDHKTARYNKSQRKLKYNRRKNADTKISNTQNPLPRP